MPVTTIPIDVGSAPGAGDGDPARTGGQSYNTSVANLDAAVEFLQSEGWRNNATTETVTLGSKTMASSMVAPITKTLPPIVGGLSTTDFNSIWILNHNITHDITVTADAANRIQDQGSHTALGGSITLQPNQGCILTEGTAGWPTLAWSLSRFWIDNIVIDNLDDVTITTVADDEILQYDSGGSIWENKTKEEADIVDRLVPALEATPYVHHETLAARSTGTETIDISAQPSVYLPITGNNVTIDLDVPALSLPVRGLADVKLAGKVFVYLDAGYSGLAVTTDATASVLKGTAPSTLGEYAVLVWEWFDDGTNDFIWAEWVNDS
jgi:hypothetical protein